MAYIPPHKRHTEGSSSLKPESLLPPDAFEKKQSFGESKRKEKDFAVAYANGATTKWFFVGFAERSFFSSHVRLQPFLVDSNFESIISSLNPLSLVLLEGCSERMDDKPWLWVAENVKQDLLSLFQRLKCEMEEVKPDVVARFGKILFYGNSSICEESLKSNPLDESTLRQQMRRILYTNIPLTYMEFIENLVVEKLHLEYAQEKEIYLVKLVDKFLPDSIVFCKCIVAKDRKKIQLQKIELNPVRRMVADVSCLGKTLDLRLIIRSKKIMKVFDEEINGIKHLIDSAIMDPGVKGGLRWPFGTDTSGGRYTVINVHHKITKSYNNSLIRFKLRHADRFDFKSSNGEVTREIFVKMPGIVSELRKQIMDENMLFKMVEENLKLIWDHCMLDDCS